MRGPLLLGCLGVFVLLLVVSALVGGTHDPPAGSTAASGTVPSAESSPSPIGPITITGQDSKLTNKFDLQPGSYKLSWKASGDTNNFIVVIHQGGDSRHLVNEIVPKPPAGEVQVDPTGGPAYLEITAANLSWTIDLSPI